MYNIKKEETMRTYIKPELQVIKVNSGNMICASALGLFSTEVSEQGTRRNDMNFDDDFDDYDEF